MLSDKAPRRHNDLHIKILKRHVQSAWYDDSDSNSDKLPVHGHAMYDGNLDGHLRKDIQGHIKSLFVYFGKKLICIMADKRSISIARCRVRDINFPTSFNRPNLLCFRTRNTMLFVVLKFLLFNDRLCCAPSAYSADEGQRNNNKVNVYDM